MRRSVTLWAAMALAGLLQCASAGPINPLTSSFNMSGTITVTPSTITWNSDLSPGFAADMFSLTAAAGSIVGANGQNAIANLNIAAQPIGTAFAPIPFITFTQSPSLPVLDLTFIFKGSGSTAGCTDPADTVGETCTLPNAPFGSPFTFTDDPPPGSGNGAQTSDAKFIFTGVTSDGLDNWTAIFTSQFGAPYQTVLAAFAPGGSQTISNSYSATVFFTPTTTVPEPGTLVLIGLGLCLVGGVKKFRKA